jgi:tripartite-type tricarboxylate transporter receptor subunit TctC
MRSARPVNRPAALAQWSTVLATLGIGTLLAVPAYPDRPGRFVVPYLPGGNVDIAARGF